MIDFESRASVVLYKYLVYNKIASVFLLPANICPIVPITFLKARVPFEFVDINPQTLCINEDLVIKKISANQDKYSGVLFNHTYGVAYSPVDLFTKLKNLDPFLKIIDDRCLSKPVFKEFNEELDGIDLILYSTGYSKYADIGFGGIGMLKDYNKQEIEFPNEYEPQDLEELQHKCEHSLKTKSLYRYNDSSWLDYRVPTISYNEYFEQVNSIIQKVEKQKYKLNNIYSAGLDSKIQYSSEFQNWRFNIRVPDKEELLKKIFSGKLFASSLYKSMGDGVFSKDHFPVASKVHNETINLFNDFYFDEKKAISVCRIINQHLSS